jgi:2-methylcitrate dehydratase
LLYGCLTAEHFSDAVANDPRIDSLRSKIFINEDPTYTDAYSDPDRRAVANAVQVRPCAFRKSRHTVLPLVQE